MKFLFKGKDGGPQSPVTGYWLVEIKSLFSIVLLHFGKGTREAFHDHAFNAVTLWLKGYVFEHTLNRQTLQTVTKAYTPRQLKYTSHNHMHKVIAPEGAWALSFRGPWKKTWQEYSARTKNFTTLMSPGRQVVNVETRRTLRNENA